MTSATGRNRRALKGLVRRLLPVVDLLLAPLVYPAALLLKGVRLAGVDLMPLCRRVLFHVGVFPLRNHYYEPQFDHSRSRRPFSEPRPLPAIDWNVEGQLETLAGLSFADELADLPARTSAPLAFQLDNGTFESGDAEVWYQVVRRFKPRRIIEIGSGNSTLLAIRAIAMNRRQDPGYRCEHVCVEPYEMPWLEQAEVRVHRARVEELDVGFFSTLQANDILFIDSSHVIRPQGDVLFEYLELLPVLNVGVVVHVHDIFSPRDYPKQWLQDEVRLWNEQYLLEAFLSHNRDWRILAALNYLQHTHHAALKAVAPFLTPAREPGSIYLQRTA